MFVEEGFRIRFANGETIDFYADSAAEKEGWMHALAEVVGKESRDSKKWTEIVLRREKAMRSQTAKTQQAQLPKGSSGLRPAPPVPNPRQSSQHATAQASPYKRPNSSQAQHSQKLHHRPSLSDAKPPPVRKDPRHMTAAERRAKTRSMLF
jgi:hypothetical protein